MLTFNREYKDGKYVYLLIPVKNTNYVKLIDEIDKKMVKEYKTEDDEAALYIYQSLIDIQERFGYDFLLNFKVKDQLPGYLVSNVEVIVEESPVDYVE
jgi:hypothetical protein